MGPLKLCVVICALLVCGCISLDDSDWMIGQWKGAISTSCSDTAEMAFVDSIFLHFEKDRQVGIGISDSSFTTTYSKNVDELVFGSLFGTTERWLNIEPRDDDTLVLSLSEGYCYYLFSLVRTDNLARTNRP